MVTPKMVSVIIFTAIHALVYHPFQQMQELSAKHDVPPRPVEIVVTQPAALPTLLEPRVTHRVHRDASGMSGWNPEGFLDDEEILGGRSKERRASGRRNLTRVLRALVSINKGCVCAV